MKDEIVAEGKRCTEREKGRQHPPQKQIKSVNKKKTKTENRWWSVSYTNLLNISIFVPGCIHNIFILFSGRFQQ